MLVDKSDFSAREHNITHAALAKGDGRRHGRAILGGENAEWSTLHNREEFFQGFWTVGRRDGRVRFLDGALGGTLVRGAVSSDAIFTDAVLWRTEATEFRVEPGNETLEKRLILRLVIHFML